MIANPGGARRGSFERHPPVLIEPRGVSFPLSPKGFLSRRAAARVETACSKRALVWRQRGYSALRRTRGVGLRDAQKIGYPPWGTESAAADGDTHGVLDAIL
jgi:hypothetical protein